MASLAEVIFDYPWTCVEIPTFTVFSQCLAEENAQNEQGHMFSWKH